MTVNGYLMILLLLFVIAGVVLGVLNRKEKKIIPAVLVYCVCKCYNACFIEEVN